MIEIDISPFLFTTDFVGSLTLSWHGFFSFVAVATAVYLVARWAPLKQVDPDVILSIAVWGIIGAVIGARAVHVFDTWSIYSDNPIRILYIWQGGVGIWGGVLGGFLSASGYAMIAEHWERRKYLASMRAKGLDDSEAGPESIEMPKAKYPVGIIADLTAPALLFAQVIGRLGDIVNGEHCAKATELFFGFRWIDPGTAARSCVDGITTSVQPVVAYEMIWNMVSLAILWQLRGRLKPNGMLFAVYLALYSVGRFSIDFLRLDLELGLGMQGSQFIALAMLAITVPLLLIKARPVARVEEAPTKFERGTRADIRRRRRSSRKAKGG